MFLPRIQSRAGLLLYLLLRNDKSWARLRPEDKELVNKANQLHNNERPDYADPELYQGGRNFDSGEDRQATVIGKKLQVFLDRTQPQSVIEVGPGSGFFTRTIVDQPSVKHLVAVDIVEAFLSYVAEALKNLKARKPDFSYEILHGDFETMEVEPVDAIVFLSTVHHIPNREELFSWVHASLKPGGSCFVSEPTHYFPRKRSLLEKFLRDYHRAEYRAKLESYSTHHFCTLEEFERICDKVPGLEISHYYFYKLDIPHFTRKIINRILNIFKITRDAEGNIYIEDRKSPLRRFSQRMIIEFKKTK